MNTKMKKFIAATVAVLGVSVAHAVSLPLFTGKQLLSDNSAEILIKSDRNSQAGIVEIGDRLVGIFSIDTAEQSPSLERTFATYGVELTGTFDITVVAKQVFFTPGGPQYFFSFAATDPTGLAVKMYSDSTIDFTRSFTGSVTTAAQMIATATDGDPFADLGFASGADFWLAQTVSDDIGSIGNIPAPGNGGNFNLGLDLINNYSGYQFNKVACGPFSVLVDVCGSGSLLGKGGESTPFASYDDVNFVVDIPEPGSLSLVGAALFSAAALRRRKQAK